MQLDPKQTRIIVEERTVEEWDFTSPTATVQSIHFSATVEGAEAQALTSITMTRTGPTPDLAIRALFGAMSDAGVTL